MDGWSAAEISWDIEELSKDGQMLFLKKEWFPKDLVNPPPHTLFSVEKCCLF